MNKKWIRTDVRVGLGALIYVLISLINPLQAQYKFIHAIDSSNLASVFFHNPTKLGYNPASEEYFVIGDFIGNDSSISKVPYFYYEMERPGQAFYYYEDQAPFIIGGSKVFGYCFDDNQNLFLAGGSSDTKIITRINNNYIPDWTIKHGHHNFRDIGYYDGHIYAIGQDEDTLGAHTILVSKFDTSGNYVKGMNFGNTFGFNDASKMHVGSSEIVAFGKGASSYGFCMMMISMDHDLDNIKYENVALSGSDILLEDMKRVIDGYILTGYIKKSKSDSAFILKVNDDFGIDYAFAFNNNEVIPLAMQGTAIEVDADGNSYIGGNLVDSSNYKRPFVIKLDVNGEVLWSRNLKNSNDGGIETVTDILLTDNEDSLMITGNYRIQDTNGTWLDPAIYVQKIELDSGRQSCGQDFSVNRSPLNLVTFDSITTQTYLGITGSYTFAQTLDFMLPRPICYTAPPILDTGSIEEILSNGGISISVDQRTLYIQKQENLEVTKSEQVQWYITDLMGRRLNYGNTSWQQIPSQLSVSNISAGMYLFTIAQSGKPLLTKKFIISR